MTMDQFQTLHLALFAIGAFAAAFLSFSVALLFMLFNMSTSFFRQYEGAMRESGRLFNAAPTLPCLERRGPQ